MNEQELRDKIADEIMAQICDPWDCPRYREEGLSAINVQKCYANNKTIEEMANIARGKEEWWKTEW